MSPDVLNPWASLAVSILSLCGAGWAVLKVAYRQGADAQKQEQLEARMAAAEGNIDKLKEALADVPVILERISSLDRMVTRDLDELKHTLRNLQMGRRTTAKPA